MDFLLFAGAALVVLLILLLLARALVGRQAAKLPYQPRDTLLTPAERSFYGVLQQAIGGEFDVFAKVRLIDLLSVPGGTRDRQAHVNRVIAKHADFVLCDRRTSAPRLVIELDDSSHRTRQDRDAFVDQAFAAAGLPLLRVPAKQAYGTRELSETVRQLVVVANQASAMAREAPAPAD